MNPMLERAAEALFRKRFAERGIRMLILGSADADADWHSPQLAEGMREMFREEVRAVVEAMREPTEAMLAIKFGKWPEDIDEGEEWRAYIDEILK